MVTRFAIGALAVSAGCHFTSHPVSDDASTDDGAPADSQTCFGPPQGNFTICLTAGQLPTAPLSFNSDLLMDTGKACSVIQTQGNGSELCVVTGTTIVIEGTVVASGPRPLVLLATEGLELGSFGVIDVATHGGGSVGAGSRFCSTAGRAGMSSVGGGGGGAGGSFGARGGGGGNGDAVTGAGGRSDPAAVSFDALAGGCDGGAGGAGDVGTGGAAGGGGGAVYLISAGTLAIGGVINASGAGARGGAATGHGNGGGGGGGAGGMIALWAVNIEFTLSAVMLANGGGGGAGASTFDGGAGSDPDPAGPTFPASGGIGPAGDAGAGGASTTEAVSGTSTGIGTGGGGGGGGSVGVIRVLSGQPTANAMVSPPAQ